MITNYNFIIKDAFIFVHFLQVLDSDNIKALYYYT